MNLETEAPKLTKRNALERRVAGWPTPDEQPVS